MSQSPHRYCSTCGALIPSDAAVCGECGARYQPSPYERHATDAPAAWSQAPQPRDRAPESTAGSLEDEEGIEFITRDSLRPADPSRTQLRRTEQYDQMMADQQTSYPQGPTSGSFGPGTSGPSASSAPGAPGAPGAPASPYASTVGNGAGGANASSIPGAPAGPSLDGALKGAVPAPFGRRLAAELIDIVIAALVGVVLLVGLIILLVQGESRVLSTVLIGIGAVLPTAYALFIIWLEGAKGVTVGKKVLGLRTVRFSSGKRLGFLRSMGRFVIYGLVPWLFGLSVFLDPNGTLRGWHDKIVDSLVVDLKKGEDPFHPKDHFERPDDAEFLGRAPVPVMADENLMAQPGSPWSAPSASSAAPAPTTDSGASGAPSATTSSAADSGWGTAPAPQASAGQTGGEQPIDRSPWAPSGPTTDGQGQDPAPQQREAPAQNPWDSSPSQHAGWGSAPDQQAWDSGSAPDQQAWDSGSAPDQQAWDSGSDPDQQAWHSGSDRDEQAWDSAPDQHAGGSDSAPQQHSAPSTSQEQSWNAPAPSAAAPAAAVPAAGGADPVAPSGGEDAWTDEVDENTRITATDDMEDLEQTRLSAIPPAARPSVRLTLDDGTERIAEGTVVVGRNPTAEDGEVQFVLKDETRSISKTHLRVQVQSDGIQVTDLGSTNGSAVVPADGDREPLVPHTATVLPEGASVAIGDRTLSVEKMP